MTHELTPIANTTPEPSGQEAFRRIVEELEEVDLTNAPAYRLEAVHASIVASGIAQRLLPFRPQLAAMPGFDLRHLDRLADWGTALRFVNACLLLRGERDRPLPALAAEATALRRLLLAYAGVFVLQGDVDGDLLRRVPRGTGHLDLIEALGLLAMLFRDHPEILGGPVGRAEIERADALVHEMSVALGLDKDADGERLALVDARHRIAVLMLTAQRELRLAMAWLRRDHGDEDTWVPSLYPEKRRRKR